MTKLEKNCKIAANEIIEYILSSDEFAGDYNDLSKEDQKMLKEEIANIIKQNILDTKKCICYNCD